MKNTAIYLILLVALSSLHSCSKSTPPITPEKPIVIVPVTPPTTPVTPPDTTSPPNSTAKWIPVKLESSTQSVVFKYIGDSNALLSADNGTGKKVIITYKDNQMNGLLIYEVNKVQYVDYYRDDQKRIIKVARWKQTENEDILLGTYTIEYNEQQQISQVTYYSDKNALQRTKSFSYARSNDQMGIITETSGTESTRYTYDQKNGLFKNVANAQFIALETGDQFFLSAEHNLLSISGTSPKNDLTCSYEYNTDAYPSLINWLTPQANMVFKVSYKTF